MSECIDFEFAVRFTLGAGTCANDNVVRGRIPEHRC